MMSIKIVTLLLAVLFGSAFCEEAAASSNIQLSVWSTSSAWWIALGVVDGSLTTTTMDLQESGSSSWKAMSNEGWGTWQLASSGSSTGFKLPLSIRLTATNGQQLVLSNVITSIVGGAVINTNAQYGGSAPATQAPTQRPNQPTQAPTQRPGSPTQAPTQRPTSAPTQRPTSAPTPRPTSAPTQKATSAPNTNLCAITSTSVEPIKLLVPLYTYPGSTWDQMVSAAQSGVQVIAIINPNSGPSSSGPDSSYTTYMAKLANAGVTMVGYVHTSYGARSITDVSNDISTYASKYTGLAGIFIDEASASSSEISYYTQVYNAIRSHSGYSNVILNPGTQPDQGYTSISTNIVVFEDNASNWKGNFASWVTCAPNAAAKAGYKYKFSGMAIAASSQSQMTSVINGMVASGLGMVYVTDQGLSGNTYGSLPAYFSQEVSTVQSIN